MSFMQSLPICSDGLKSRMTSVQTAVAGNAMKIGVAAILKTVGVAAMHSTYTSINLISGARGTN